MTVDYGSLPLAFPCTCVGLCDADCECRAGGHFCDQVCQCPTTCVNRWQGCDCTCNSRGSGDEDEDQEECCRLKRECACVRAGRECGRMCKCARSKWGVEAGCVNRVIGAKLVDPQKYTYVDLSHVPNGGWGLFALCPLSRSFPLGEYTGEVITDAEADRRGLVYDEMKLNYFFDLANDAVVDAFRLGNALRFINHGSGKAANVEPKVVMVNGSQRILLRTKRAVGAGQELVMDYGPKYQLWKGGSLELDNQ
ncbi:hypothetical protein BCR44DRAFT_129315 [Catenaria anguillulae PL171]|uniref:SET domain-containing protein n=1 Tax=Catenaria anguillulae PL171 TaxID=765915 RepID=A0A1Y2HU73_9FUNG|nr:hypothetical protein BCR44DRAFT_129315 [Catenaria anguillulae PL171]